MGVAPLGIMLLQDFTPPESAALARRIEALGYESLWVADSRGQEPPIRIAACAPVTSHLRLGTGVLNVFQRAPFPLAQTALSLADLTAGRFLLGLGTGHAETVEDTPGVPFAQPVTQLAGAFIPVRRSHPRVLRWRSSVGLAWYDAPT